MFKPRQNRRNMSNFVTLEMCSNERLIFLHLPKRRIYSCARTKLTNNSLLIDEVGTNFGKITRTENHTGTPSSEILIVRLSSKPLCRFSSDAIEAT